MTIAVTMINFAVLKMSQQLVLITFWIFTVTRARHKLIIMVMHMVEGRYTKNKWVFVSEFPTITINDSNVSVKLSIVFKSMLSLYINNFSFSRLSFSSSFATTQMLFFDCFSFEIIAQYKQRQIFIIREIIGGRSFEKFSRAADFFFHRLPRP